MSVKATSVANFLLNADARGAPPPTLLETAAACGVSVPYVSRIKGRLVRLGQLARAGSFRPGRPGRPSVSQETDPSDILAAIQRGDAVPMTLDERRAFLSELARVSDREEIKVQAISALNRLEGSIQTSDHLGPPDPLTMIEFDERLTQLIIAREDILGAGFRRR